MRLFTRTTRRIAPTDAGERLLATIGPRLEGIEADLAALGELRDKPAANIRITASEHAADAPLMPRLKTLLPDYPDIKIEINTNYQMVEPRKPQDLTAHDCINVRLPTHGGLLQWDFKKGAHQLNVRVEGTLIFNGFPQIVNAAVDGLGLAFVVEEVVLPHLAGRLVR